MATEINIKNLTTGFQSIITNGKHSIVGDEPIESTGTDLGLSPKELLLSSLALCKVATIRNTARLKNWEIGEVNAVLSQEETRGEKGLKTIVSIKIIIEGAIDESQKEELLKQANRCTIHRMIMGEWDIQPIVLA